jgi:hypothetical protein
MSEDKEPDRLAQLAMLSEAVRRDIELGRQFFRGNETVIRQVQEAQQFFREYQPLIHQVQQLQPVFQAQAALWRQIESIVRANEALAQQVAPIVQAAERFAGAWPLAPFQQMLVRTVGTAMGELTLSAPAAHQRTASLAVTPAMAATAAVTASLDLTVRPAPSAGHGTVKNRPSGQAERSIGQILALALVAIVASGLLGVQGPDRAAVDHYLTVIGVALTVAVLIWDKQNKPK